VKEAGFERVKERGVINGESDWWVNRGRKPGWWREVTLTFLNFITSSLVHNLPILKLFMKSRP